MQCCESPSSLVIRDVITLVVMKKRERKKLCLKFKTRTIHNFIFMNHTRF